MSIALQTKEGRTKIEISDTEWGMPLFEKKIFIIDSCIAFPIILPRKKRNVSTLMKCSKKVTDSKKVTELMNFTGDVRFESYLRSSTEKLRRRQIEVINSLEDGGFKKRGVYIGITNTVLNELKTFEGIIEKKNVENWTKSVGDYIYKIFLDVSHLRRRYQSISKLFDEDGDFSLAIASYLMGCNIVTDDYRSFNIPTMKRFCEIYDDRWRLKKVVEKHDSDSLLMLLRGP